MSVRTPSKEPLDRRDFLARLSAGAVGIAVTGPGCSAAPGPGPHPASDTGGANRAVDPLFRISLAEWSLHRALQSGELTNLGFPGVARRDYGIDAVEYVNSFFGDQGEERAYLQELLKRCEDEGVRSLLIMCDGEGRLGDPDEGARKRSVENHYRWVEAARFLGCHSIRVNAASEGSWDEQRERAADGLSRLADFAEGFDIDVIVENHGGLSSNGRWLSSVIASAGHPRVGTLPDFGNFAVTENERYDNYKGVAELMPHARAVSAKSYDFGDAGDETELDYERLIRIVLDAGYRGWIGIEYEGQRLPEPEGIRRTRALLEKVRDRLAPEYG